MPSGYSPAHFLQFKQAPAIIVNVMGTHRVSIRSPFATLAVRFSTLGSALLAFTSVATATVTTLTVFSPSNNRNVSFQVYTPPGYTTDTSRLYPVVISLHGIGGTSSQRASQYGPVLDTQINNSQILPAIWIFPDGQTNSFYGNAYDGHKQVYSQIIDEQLPYVDSHYRTIADRGHRAMEGFSMGGFGAAMLAAKRTDLFSAIVEYGGALSTWQNLVQFNNAVAVEMYNSVEANFQPYSLWDVTDANAVAIRSSLNYKMIVGDSDSQYNSNTRWRDHLLSLNIDPHFQIVAGAEHVATDYLNDASGLHFLSDHFASVFRREGDFDQNGATNTNDYSAWRSSFGSTSQLTADGNENGRVDAADYVVWRRQTTLTSSALSLATAAPEPSCLAILFSAAFYRFVTRGTKKR
jgi:S-formylglutathione hydrolase FrmB